MRIVTTNVTRMYNGRVCVAGVDTRSRRHIRPVLPYEVLTSACLREHGGIFGLGWEVDLGPVAACGAPPEVEDHRFHLPDAHSVRDAGQEALLALLAELAADDPEDVFGPELHTPDGQPTKLVTAAGCGRASLGVWRPARKPRLSAVNGRAMLECSCRAGYKRLAVTDVRLHCSDMKTVNEVAVERAQAAIRAAPGVLLCVGLSRPWVLEGTPAPMHRLQVNGIHPLPVRAPAHRDVRPPLDGVLFERLRRLRWRIATENGMPAYLVFPDSVLRSIAVEQPTTRERLLAVRGVGPAKLAEFGSVFLAEIAAHLQGEPPDDGA